MDTATGTKRAYFPGISWGAVFGGLVSGMAMYLLLTLLGVAAGLSAIDPQGAEPVGRVPMLTGIWTGISMIAAAFTGAYVTTRMSGMTRQTDGILHGLVSWGVSTLFFAYLVTTSVGGLLGGTFSMLGKGAKALGGAATGAGGAVASSSDARSRLESLITGGGDANVSSESVTKVQERLQAGDRDGAINVMVNEMHFTPDRAATAVDSGMSLFGSAKQAAGELPGKAKEAAATAVSGASKAIWVVFLAIFLSMATSMWGGSIGAKAAAKRRLPPGRA